jgi:hypothetical protein
MLQWGMAVDLSALPGYAMPGRHTYHTSCATHKQALLHGCRMLPAAGKVDQRAPCTRCGSDTLQCGTRCGSDTSRPASAHCHSLPFIRSNNHAWEGNWTHNNNAWEGNWTHNNHAWEGNWTHNNHAWEDATCTTAADVDTQITHSLTTHRRSCKQLALGNASRQSCSSVKPRAVPQCRELQMASLPG